MIQLHYRQIYIDNYASQRISRGGVCAVEWSEHVADALEDPILVTLEREPGRDELRRITVKGRRLDEAAGL